jgi:hypothetical protein
VGPLLPALLRGEILGHPYTDLFPSVWGLGWFAAGQPGFPLHADSLGWPEGSSFYYSSPIHGYLATPLLALGLGLGTSYNLLLLGARVASVLLGFAWLRAEGLGARGALAGAALYACAPFFHGYAVEGIVEGCDGWTLPLWGLLLARRRPLAATLAFFLVVLSSWYLGAAALLVAVARTPARPLALPTALGGCLLALPAFLAFSAAFPEASPLPDEVRAAMGSSLIVPRPGLRAGLDPFAKTSYLGWLAGGLFLLGLRRRPLLAVGAMLAWGLSLGVGPWYALPGLEMLRFPYRLVAATLFLAAPVVAEAVDRLPAWASPAGLLIAAEGLLLSPVEPIVPGTDPSVPAIYASVRATTLLEVPGPVAMPPGEVNLSRPRARYLLYDQHAHGAASPWRFDFNGVSASVQAPWLLGWMALDPLCRASAERPSPCGLQGEEPDVEALRRAGVEQVMLHGRELGSDATRLARRRLEEGGATLVAREADLLLYELGDPHAPQDPLEGALDHATPRVIGGDAPEEALDPHPQVGALAVPGT